MQGESEKVLPESMDVDEAAARMEPGMEPEEAPDSVSEGPDSEGPNSEGADSEAAVEAEAPEPETPEEGPPEFWSADDKAAWRDVPAELRPVLKKYEQQRVAFVNEKAREAAEVRSEAAQVREQARAEVERHAKVVDAAARWWGEAGPALQRAFTDKWAQVDWNALAEKNPGEWARLNQQRLDEAGLLAEANRRGETDRQAAEQRAGQQFHEQRRAEHAKLADRLPDFFGTPDAAHKTYGELGRFLLAKGIAAERINEIYEAPVIELALGAWRFEQAQQHALRSAARVKEGASAKPTPTRVAPGPAAASREGRAGNRGSEAARQVGERFRQGGGSSLADAAELIRLNDL